MPNKLECPICRTGFLLRQEVSPGGVVECPVCGGRLEITSVEPQVECRKAVQPPPQEIVGRVDAFARLRGYTFNENRALVLEGLLEKHELHGDFFCPCRLENVPENICPCLETRMGQVKQQGECRCGFFVLPRQTR